MLLTINFFIGLFQGKLTFTWKIYRTASFITVALHLIFEICFSKLLFLVADRKINEIYQGKVNPTQSLFFNNYSSTCVFL